VEDQRAAVSFNAGRRINSIYGFRPQALRGKQAQSRQRRVRRVRLRHGALRITGTAPVDAHATAFPHLAAARLDRVSVRVESPDATSGAGRLDSAAGQHRGSSEDDALVGRAIPISKGHWDSDTLVIDTDGFRNNTLLDNLVPHGYDLKTTERIRLKDADTLEDRILIEDPKYFTRPWQTVVTYRRQPDDPFPENVCLDTRSADGAAVVKP
jgi:hypothetical protein